MAEEYVNFWSKFIHKFIKQITFAVLQMGHESHPIDGTRIVTSIQSIIANNNVTCPTLLFSHCIHNSSRIRNQRSSEMEKVNFYMKLWYPISTRYNAFHDSSLNFTISLLLINFISNNHFETIYIFEFRKLKSSLDFNRYGSTPRVSINYHIIPRFPSSEISWEIDVH